MQGYQWEERYNFILLQRRTNHIGDDKLKAFLQRAHLHLRNGNQHARSCDEPLTFINVLDNMALTEKTIRPIKGQVVRNVEDLQRIFASVGFREYRCSRFSVLSKDYHPTKAWALC